MQKQDRPVAFFDSGLGGISVLRETVRLLPQENYLYYGDSLHAPYGVRPEAEIRALAEQIRASGAKSVIITGVERGESLYNCILDSDGYDERRVPLLPFRMHGTGDLFSSVLAGGLMTGHTLRESVDSAARFVALAMQASAGYDDSMRRGVCFEPHLALLAGGLCAE